MSGFGLSNCIDEKVRIVFIDTWTISEPDAELLPMALSLQASRALSRPGGRLQWHR